MHLQVSYLYQHPWETVQLIPKPDHNTHLEISQKVREAEAKILEAEDRAREAEKRAEITIEEIRFSSEKHLNEQMGSLKKETEDKIEEINRSAEERFNQQGEDFRQKLEEKDRESQARVEEIQRSSGQRIDELVHQNEDFADKQKELLQVIKNNEGHVEQLLESEREFNRIQATRR